jgi:elongation factor P hydroxylase
MADETFYFCASDIVVMPTNFVAETMQQFAQGLREVSVHSIHHHFIEARLRLKLMSNDFSQWLHEDAGLTDTARALNRIDIYTATLEGVRSQMVRIVERALA